ncbi:hypothetical protein CV093_16855 [Oceanobacillus sp. 143]|nr:hypothetical protein CV093_16855 [Oceanobacillus sp. 143]
MRICNKNDYTSNDILQYLGDVLELKSFETVQMLMDQLINLMNNTRKWILKGHTSMELSPNRNQALPNSISNQKAGKKKVKIGRNDPCPCGSGKKYKKCCGR